MRIREASVGPYARVAWATDAASGLRAIVAVHSTALGPAVGGTRMHPYPDDASAVIDVLRLAEGMTLKAAAAGLDVGGGKGVIIGDPARDKGPALLAAYARLVDHFAGAFLTAEDVGTTCEDMAVLRGHTRHVLGLPERLGGGGDPSPHTARGVVAAMRAAWDLDRGRDLEGVRVVVQGAGKVGGPLAGLLAGAGARVSVADAVPARAEEVARRTGATPIPAGAVLTTPCDILCPCAMGGVIDARDAPALRCRWVIGSANNQLTDDAAADALAAHGIGYVPDFVANAGGLISVAEERSGWVRARVEAAVDGIGATVRDLLEQADDDGLTPLAVARRRAAERLTPAAAP